jgi:hypothetical protein
MTNTKTPDDLITRLDRVLRAPPEVWSVGDLLPLLKDCAAWFHALESAGYSPLELESSDPAGPFLLPVDKTTPADVLRLFRAFVLRNVTQWKMGAGDHHHPIWEHLAVNIEGDDPTSGPEYEYLEPLNRERLSVLKMRAEASG